MLFRSAATGRKTERGIAPVRRSIALTYQDIGSPAIMSRATAGIIKGRVLFSTPGSENAVRLAMEKLILPELGHLVKELTK